MCTLSLGGLNCWIRCWHPEPRWRSISLQVVKKVFEFLTYRRLQSWSWLSGHSIIACDDSAISSSSLIAPGGGTGASWTGGAVVFAYAARCLFQIINE
jgi:hypothetical protein